MFALSQNESECTENHFFLVLTTEGSSCTAYNQVTVCQRQLDFFGYVMSRNGLEILVAIGKAEEGQRQRLKYLDNLWKDKLSPTQLITATEDRLLWYCTIANVVNDHMTP